MGFEPVGEECPIPNEYPFGKENKALVPFILYVKVKFIWITKLFLFNFFNWLTLEREGGQREWETPIYCSTLFPLFMHSLVDSCMCPDQGSNPGVLVQCSNQLSYWPGLTKLFLNYHNIKRNLGDICCNIIKWMALGSYKFPVIKKKIWFIYIKKNLHEKQGRNFVCNIQQTIGSYSEYVKSAYE